MKRFNQKSSTPDSAETGNASSGFFNQLYRWLTRSNLTVEPIVMQPIPVRHLEIPAPIIPDIRLLVEPFQPQGPDLNLIADIVRRGNIFQIDSESFRLFRREPHYYPASFFERREAQPYAPRTPQAEQLPAHPDWQPPAPPLQDWWATIGQQQRDQALRNIVAVPEDELNESKLENYLDLDIDFDFICAISRSIMTHPVYDPACPQQKFDLLAIKIWLEQNPTNPVTRTPLQFEDLVYDEPLKARIDQFVSQTLAQSPSMTQ